MTKIILTALYFLALFGFAGYGLLACFWRERAVKYARTWTALIRMQSPTADWDSVNRSMVPPRPIGFLLFLVALCAIYFSLRAVLAARPMAVATLPVLPAESHHFSSAIGLAAFSFFGLSIYMLIDPLGLYCFFTRQSREHYAPRFKRGWAVTGMALVFLAVTGYLLLGLIRN
jgi:hypothetical protein